MQPNNENMFLLYSNLPTILARSGHIRSSQLGRIPPHRLAPLYIHNPPPSGKPGARSSSQKKNTDEGKNGSLINPKPRSDTCALTSANATSPSYTSNMSHRATVDEWNDVECVVTSRPHQ